MISLNNITKSYGSIKAVDNLSLKIQKGETISLIGPSGCGKSTLVRIVMGLIKPDKGKIKIGDEVIREDNILSIRRKIGYVIQKGGLFPHLTARENCELTARFLNWNKDQINERFEELASLTKINTSILSRYPSELSGGQQQRISLIRALMLNPNILLLDEPLGSIDPLVRYELQTDLKAIFKQLNKTVLLVTHDLGEAAFLSGHLVLMNNGAIEQEGSLDSLIKTPNSDFVTRFVTAQRNHLDEVKG